MFYYYYYYLDSVIGYVVRRLVSGTRSDENITLGNKSTVDPLLRNISILYVIYKSRF